MYIFNSTSQNSYSQKRKSKINLRLILFILFYFFFSSCNLKKSSNTNYKIKKVKEFKEFKAGGKKKEIEKVKPESYAKTINKCSALFHEIIKIPKDVPQHKKENQKKLREEYKISINEFIEKDKTESQIFIRRGKGLIRQIYHYPLHNTNHKPVTSPKKYNLNEYLKNIINDKDPKKWNDYITDYIQKYIFMVIDKVEKTFQNTSILTSKEEGLRKLILEVIIKAKSVVTDYFEIFKSEKDIFVKKILGTDDSKYFINICKYFSDILKSLMKNYPTLKCKIPKLDYTINKYLQCDPEGEGLHGVLKHIETEFDFVTKEIGDQIDRDNTIRGMKVIVGILKGFGINLSMKPDLIKKKKIPKQKALYALDLFWVYVKIIYELFNVLCMDNKQEMLDKFNSCN